MQKNLFIAAAVIAALVVAGFTLFGGFQNVVQPQKDTTATTTQGGHQIGNVRVLRVADSRTITATMCRNAVPDETVVEFTIQGSRILPTCAMAREHQSLRIINETDVELVVSFNRLPPDAAHFATTTIPAGSNAQFDMPFRQYLAQGVHILTLSDGRSFELVMLD